MRDLVPIMFIIRFMLYASTCRLISVLTRSSVLVRKCVEPIQAFSVPNGCSTVARRIRIASGLRVGTRVKKKQVVGKVGSTGRSTGPHLHFGMKRHGSYINPLEVDFKRGTPLNRGARAKFLSATATLAKQMDAP